MLANKQPICCVEMSTLHKLCRRFLEFFHRGTRGWGRNDRKPGIKLQLNWMLLLKLPSLLFFYLSFPSLLSLSLLLPFPSPPLPSSSEFDILPLKFKSQGLNARNKEQQACKRYSFFSFGFRSRLHPQTAPWRRSLRTDVILITNSDKVYFETRLGIFSTGPPLTQSFFPKSGPQWVLPQWLWIQDLDSSRAAETVLDAPADLATAVWGSLVRGGGGEFNSQIIFPLQLFP